MQTRDEQTTSPPPAPELDRRFRMRPVQAWGMAVIAVIPICAALGLFDARNATRTASTASIELAVDYPTRCRYEVVEVLEVRVSNRSAEPLERVTVVFDAAYLKGFSQQQFTPTLQRAFEVDLEQLQPGETRRISGEIQGENYGRYRGRIDAKAGGQTASVDVSTFIFP